MPEKEVITLPDKERLQLVINTLGYKSAKNMADSIGVYQSEFSRILKGKRPISAAVAYAIAKYHTDISPVWLVEGLGEMLMSKKVSEKRAKVETNFNQNLSAFMSVMDYSLDLIASQTNVSIHYITSLLEGHQAVDLDFLISLRNAFNIALDDWLFEDFNLPENMKSLKESTGLAAREAESMKIVTYLEAKIKELEQRERDREKTFEVLIKRIEAIETAKKQ